MTGFFLGGGDQYRYVTSLMHGEAQTDSKVLAAIRAKLARGAVVAGSSAGAQIMAGTDMITGDSYEGLRDGSSDSRTRRGAGWLRSQSLVRDLVWVQSPSRATRSRLQSCEPRCRLPATGLCVQRVRHPGLRRGCRLCLGRSFRRADDVRIRCSPDNPNTYGSGRAPDRLRVTQVRSLSAHVEITHGAGSPGPEHLVGFAHAEIAPTGDRPRRSESDAVDGPVPEDVLNAAVAVLAATPVRFPRPAAATSPPRTTPRCPSPVPTAPNSRAWDCSPTAATPTTTTRPCVTA
ncbi:hypothetical protein [Streptomyces sp. A0642]|uniref:hypothetical protein n=1 Tax=Streptomyces sp. A0642 TaxID=2563100 RepID=UPI001F0FD317|nr:hypothetical protein [Streptomyces sp. A0642]